MNRRTIFVLLALSLSPTVAACGDDEASSSTKSSTLQLNGTYRPTEQGAIGSITFTGNKNYLLMPSGCTGGGCADLGTYRIDAETNTVVLENSVTHHTRSITLENVKTSDIATALVKSLAPRDLVEPGTQLTRTGQQTTNGQQQVTGNQQELASNGNELAKAAGQLLQQIIEALMNKQGMKQDEKPKEEEKPKEDEKPKPDDCKTGVPNGDTPLAEATAYWQRCPGGP